MTRHLTDEQVETQLLALRVQVEQLVKRLDAMQAVKDLEAATESDVVRECPHCKEHVRGDAQCRCYGDAVVGRQMTKYGQSPQVCIDGSNCCCPLCAYEPCQCIEAPGAPQLIPCADPTCWVRKSSPVWVETPPKHSMSQITQVLALQCDRPNAGWSCSRGRGHSGPCALSSADSARDWRHDAKVPRSSCLDLRSELEQAIADLIPRVERLGAHPKLTQSVIALGRAMDELAAWIDECVLKGEWRRPEVK